MTTSLQDQLTTAIDDPTLDASDKALHAAVAALAECVVRRELGGYGISQAWGEPHCVLFRLADGRTGSVEVQVNWDVVPMAAVDGVTTGEQQP